MKPIRWRPSRFALFQGAFVVAAAALVLVFRGGPSANPLSRALTVLALVEDGTLRADRWSNLTIDRAIIDGHVFSDKAPLSSFVVVPFYWFWRAVNGGSPAVIDVDIVVFLGDVVAAALPFGAFVVLLYLRAAGGMRPREAVWAALLAALGTPLLSYGSTYFGHVLAGTLFVFAYDAATRAESTPASHRCALAAGFLVGLAVTADLTLGIGAVTLGGYLATRRPRQLLAHYVAGGLPCALGLAIYNARVTGSPFDSAYQHTTSIFYQPSPLRIDRHTLTVARELLFGEYRGLFFYAPALLVLAPLAYARAARQGRGWLLAGYTGAHFLFVASYWAWAGGWCIGPRHLTPIAMVLLYEGVGALSVSTVGWRAASAALASIGVGANLLAVATNPKVEGATHPFRDLYWPAFLRGEMTSDSVFRDLGLAWGRGTVYVWCGLFVVTAAFLAWAAERASVTPPAPSAGRGARRACRA